MRTNVQLSYMSPMGGNEVTEQSKGFVYIIGALVIWLLLLLTFQFLLNMKQIQEFTRKNVAEHQIALILEGPTFDQAWNSAALQTMYKLQDKYHFDLEIVQEVDRHKIKAVASNLADSGYDLIMGHGIVFSEPFTEVAAIYPNTRFVTLNGTAHYPNQTVIQFDMEPAGYIIGKLATLMSKTKTVGFIVADMPNDKPLAKGLERGVKETDPSARALIKFIPDYNDTKAAVKAARNLMIEHKADVIYSAGDSINLQVINEVQKRNVLAIGYISDQRFLAPNHVISSLVQDVEQIYTTLIEQYLQKKLQSGTVLYGLNENVNCLGPYGKMVPVSVQMEMNHTIEKLKRANAH